MTAANFQAFIEELVHRHGTAQAVADLIGMSLSAFSRGVRAGTLNEENLLRLAQASGTDPSQVLRLAGKAGIAALIESMYGKPSEPLSDTDRQLLTLSPGVKRQVVRLARELGHLEHNSPSRAKRHA